MVKACSSGPYVGHCGFRGWGFIFFGDECREREIEYTITDSGCERKGRVDVGLD